MKQLLRKLAMALFRFLGTEIRDVRSGKSLGHALVVAWRGRVFILGGDGGLIPTPVPQERLTYWKQEIGFTTYPPVSTVRRAANSSAAAKAPAGAERVLLVLLDHRRAPEVLECAKKWRRHGFATEDILVLHGGTTADFEALDWPAKLHLSDPRLRTQDNQRQRQSYREVFQKSAAWMQGHDFTHVLFAEYDHLPLASDLPARHLAEMHRMDADLLAHRLIRIDRTTHPHWLYHHSEPPSPDANPQPVYAMLGTGHFWKREAWEAVAADRTHDDWYLELDLPTTAAENGFRIVGISGQEDFVVNLPENLGVTVEQAISRGAWSIHPIKPAPSP